MQDAIREAALEAARYQKALCRAGLDEGQSLRILETEFAHRPEIPDPTAHLTANGAEIVRLDKDRIRAFEAAVEPVFRKWVREIGEAFVAAARRDMESGE